jgi:serine/threonine protein kinase
MESIIRDQEKKINLENLYSNIQEGKRCPGYYRRVYLAMGEKEEKHEYLILETLGKGSMGFVFLGYSKRRLFALKMSYNPQEEDDIFSTVKKIMGDDYKKYFLTPLGKTVTMNSFYLGDIEPANKHFFDREIYLTSWEPAEATLAEKLGEKFEIKLAWYRQFLESLRIIHTRDRAHFDIKLANLFLVNNRLKIGDFDLYTKIDEFKASDIRYCGTIGYMAPEIFYDRNLVSTKVDIFSAGIAFTCLFTGRKFKGPWELTPREEENMKRLYSFTGILQFLNDSSFQKNFIVSRYYQTLLEQALAVPGLPAAEKALYEMLLRMITPDPANRPDVEKLLEEINAFPGTPILIEASIEPGENPIDTIKDKKDPFQQLLQTHDKREVLKYCLVPDLLEKLKTGKIKYKIKDILFEGDDYDKTFFSFTPLENNTKILLFGKEISGEQVKNPGDWNLLVITNYWNRSFQLGLEKTRDKKYIKKLLDGETLDDLERDVFYNYIKTTQDKILKTWKKVREV